MPTLNEADCLPRALRSAQKGVGVEVIVVDAGSTDETVRVAVAAGCRVIGSPAGRAVQMNRGARASRGGILLFLHADTQLPCGFDRLVRRTLKRRGVVAGAFRLRLNARGWPMRIIERGVELRSRLFQMPYGDQALFLRRDTFEQLGGYPEWPILEDFELVRRLRRIGRVHVTSATVLSSARRWHRLGPWRNTALNQVILLGYWLGVPLGRLAAWYSAGGVSSKRPEGKEGSGAE